MASEDPKNIPKAYFDTALVTGGTGFVGRRLVDRLLSSDLVGDVVVGTQQRDQPTGACRTVVLDLTSQASIFDVIRNIRPQLVLHLGAQASVAGGERASAETWRVNTFGTAHLAEALAESCPLATVVFPSSAEVYGRAFDRGVADEDTTPEPLSVYARSKLAAEYALRDILASSNKLVIVRPSNHSGAGQDPRFVIPSFARQLSTSRGEIYVGNLSAIRDFLHVDDVVEAYVSLVAATPNFGARSIFNISSETAAPISHLLSRLIELSGKHVLPVVDKDRLRPLEIIRAEVSSQRIRQATNWRPARDLDRILLDVLSEHSTSIG